jgi:uncharacterized protein (TIGR02996 family)
VPTTEEAFLKDIEAHPEDDTPRLIYADWLSDRDDPVRAARGEFIRLQCRLARLPADDPGRPALAARERELLSEFEAEWLGPDVSPELGWVFERGFVTGFEPPGLFVDDSSRDKSYYSYLRFYRDGLVLDVTASDPRTQQGLRQLLRWFRRDNEEGFFLRGTYHLRFTTGQVRLSFEATSSYGTICYQGVIAGANLVLDIHSLINDYRGTGTYKLIRLSKQQLDGAENASD